MNQLLAIALGGSFGAVFRFLVSTGIYQWLGRGFPFGTLVVNIIGSFLLGLLTEALVVQRITFAHDYRAAILVGFIGAFTTFSTFSLETLYLIEQGSLTKAAGNIFVSVTACILAVWLGLLCSRGLFFWSEGAISWKGITIPYALMVINLIGAFIIGFVAALVLTKTTLPEPSLVTLMAVVIGTYLVLSGLYITLYLIDQGHSFSTQINLLLGTYAINTVLCLLVIWVGFVAAKDL
ncbi:protein CrcB [Methyloglobulus morosus KoM1]|uniref:Fluoride-specific ion channel FluC n=1 Tax=Methyloglobulus morosus KoM1 TaxID=1116472 RepID=V5CAX4_9GAMM|nr:fluoride efflux transporter CrcB [Methyloglobulus morosus]ESS73963.1 protein CrcB [Methyloglobulus morosus KoM1]